MSNRCPSCDQETTTTGSFCPNCGAELEAKGPVNRGFKSYIAYILLAAILIAHLSIQAVNIGRPFYGVNEDDNGVYGLGAENQAKFGFPAMKFGIATSYLNSAKEVGKSFYTDHPQWFIVPAAVSYKLFGVSETTTRLPSVIFSLLSILAFYFTVYLFYEDKKIALFSAAAYALFPGLTFYSGGLNEKAFTIFFTNFALLAYFLAQRYQGKYLKPLLLATIFIGGLQGWYFYFAPVGLWLYSLVNKQVRHRKFLLISIPAVSIGAFLFNFLHFYVLVGFGFMSIFDQFLSKSGRLPLDIWGPRYGLWLSNNFTWPAVLVGFGFLVYVLYRFANDRKFNLALIYIVQPVLMVVVFQGWTMHAFGPLFWAQFIALAFGFTLNQLFSLRPKQLQVLAAIWAAVLMALFLGYSYGNSKIFNYEEGILNPSDTRLLKLIEDRAPRNATIGLGSNTETSLFSYVCVVEWYLQRNVSDWQKEPVDLFLAFNPSLDPANAAQVDEIQRRGYRLVAQADNLWLYERK